MQTELISGKFFSFEMKDTEIKPYNSEKPI